MADEKKLEERLQELEERVNNFDDKKQTYVKSIAEKYGWEWNKDKEPGYTLTTEDKIKFLEYGINFAEDGRRILIVGEKSIQPALETLLSGLNHTVVYYSSRSVGIGAITRSHFNAVVCGSKQGLQNRNTESFLSQVKRSNDKISTILFLEREEDLIGDIKPIDVTIKNPVYDVDEFDIEGIIKQEKEKKGAIDHINSCLIMHDILEEKAEIESRKSNINKHHPDLDFTEYLELLQLKDIEIDYYLSPSFDFEGRKPHAEYSTEKRGSGVASGALYMDFKRASRALARGKNVIMYVDDLNDLNMNQIKLLRRADGIIFNRYSEMSHHVIDFISFGIPIIQAESTSGEEKKLKFGDFEIEEGKPMSFDGILGEMYMGRYPIQPSPVPHREDASDSGRVRSENFQEIMRKSREVIDGRIEVMINADDTKTIEDAREFYVESVGLVRSENLLKQKQSNIDTFGAYFMSLLMGDDEDRRKGKPKTLKYRKKESFRGRQKTAFYRILKHQEGRRTQIRLLDAPLNEFFDEETISILAKKHPEVKQEYVDQFKEIVRDPDTHRELRGVVMGERYPEIYESQIDAMFAAWTELEKDSEQPDPDLKIFIPFVYHIDHVKMVQEMAERINQEKYGGKVKYDLGVTLETPGALWSAQSMLEAGIRHFTFGTNDLFPMIENANRNKQRAAYVEKDGHLVMNPAILKALKDCLHSMASAGVPREEYEVGISGEMNSTKLYNLAEIIPALDYVSASRPRQAAVLNAKLAQIFIGMYSENYPNANE
jgi:phosphoenolpyruvate synthase/pyruvate phosphate dikinase